MSLGSVVTTADLEAALREAGNRAYSAAYLSRYYARTARAGVFCEHREVDLRGGGRAVATFTASPWSGRNDIAFTFVQSAHPISRDDYGCVIEHCLSCAPRWGMRRAMVSVTDREPEFHLALHDAGFKDAAQGFVVVTDLTDPLLEDLSEPPLDDVDITPLDHVVDPAMLERVAGFVAENYRTVPMPYEVGALDTGFMRDEILDPITVRPASMVMHRGEEVCGFCHVIDVVGTAEQTEWPIIVTDKSVRGRGVGFAASVRALRASKRMGFVRDISFAATTNTAVEKQYSGYGGQVVGRYWKLLAEL